MLEVAIIIILIGVLLWAANTYVPMDSKVKKVLNIFVIVGLIIWLLSLTGVFSYISSHDGIPRIH